MDKQYAIFDMDGTLVDSMVYWRGLAKEYLSTKGIPQVPADIWNKLQSITVIESATLFVDTFGLTETPAQVLEEMHQIMAEHYRHRILLKPGVADYLRNLKAKGVRLCVASATAIHLMESCLKRLGVLDCFDFLLSCETKGISKTRPDIYLEAAEKFGSRPAETAVYEDALYAATTAKKADFYLVAVYDQWEKGNWAKMEALADETIYFEEGLS